MKITLGKEKKDIIYYLIVVGLLLWGIAYSSITYPELVIVYLVLSFLLIPKIDLSQVYSFVVDPALAVLSAFFAIYADHFITSYNHPFLVGQFSIIYLLCKEEASKFVLEFIFVIAFFLILRAFFVPSKVASFISVFPLLLLSVTDYYVYLTRGAEFIPSDIYGIETAINVASNYRYPVFIPILSVIVPFGLFVTAMIRLKTPKKESKSLPRIIVYALLALIMTSSLFITTHYLSSKRTIMIWADEPSHFNGFITNFGMMLDSMFVRPPVGYSRSDLETALAASGTEDPSAVSDRSNIIIIMNESYSDLSIYSDSGVLEQFEEPAPFFNSLSENTIRGYAYSSVYGGRTANTEFEFLTGITTAGLPDGATPFSMYINSDIYSLPFFLQERGYDTTAMHPCYSNGWSRDKVYPLIGFENMYFIEDFDYDDSDLFRDYISDMCAYENLITRIEADEGTNNQFYFLVTMQNHGGYNNEYPNFPLTDYVTYDGDYGLELNTFLSLMHESDRALEYLIDYLSTQDERYTVLVFGDHQPNIDIPGSFDAGGDKWIVPYLLWTNYDMPQSLLERDSNTTSINYLALDVLDAAGIHTNGYFDYVRSIRDEIPVINAAGYMTNGQWHEISEPSDALNRYLDLRYYALFDN